MLSALFIISSFKLFAMARKQQVMKGTSASFIAARSEFCVMRT